MTESWRSPYEEDRMATSFFQHVVYMDYLDPKCTTYPPAEMMAAILLEIFKKRLADYEEKK